jgi:hypothetical protein
MVAPALLVDHICNIFGINSSVRWFFGAIPFYLVCRFRISNFVGLGQKFAEICKFVSWAR